VGPDGGLTTVDGGLVSPNAPQPHIGYDLDGVCTCCGAPPSCTQFPSSKENCDDDAGRDNTGIKLFRDLGPSAQAGNQLVNQSMYNGEYGIILEITGYNGQPNDRQVTVNVFASNGMVLDGGAGPHHDGTDKWTVDPRYLNNGTFLVGMDCENNPSCVPVYSDSDAYVSCGVLVAKTFTTQPVPFTFGGRAAFGGAQMALQDPYVVGNLVQTTVFGGNVGWSITNGSVSGRWESQAALSNMASIPDPTVDSGAFLCGTDQLYPTVKSIVCGLQDIRSTPTSDNMGLPCDSLSVAFGFTASQVQLGQVASIPLTPAGCFGEGGAEAGAPFMDSCE